MLYRKATIADAPKIALLHTVNWRNHYRGMLDDHYLDHEALADRNKVWKARLLDHHPSMRMVLAEDKNEIVGFGCMFLDDDPIYGALLDNLHVANPYSGKGVGKILMELLAKDVLAMNSRRDLYLWVLKKNTGAIGFYQRQKGLEKEHAVETEMGNVPVDKIRYYWPDVTTLIAAK